MCVCACVCVRACVPNVMKIWEPKPPGALWATPGLLRDSFTLPYLFTYIYIYIYVCVCVCVCVCVYLIYMLKFQCS